MSNEWIKVRNCLPGHPKVAQIASAFCPQDARTLSAVVGALVQVWAFFDTHSTDGLLRGFRPEMLDALVQWPGFATAMIAVDWLRDDGRSLEIRDFFEHNGYSAKRRAADSRRKENVRKLSATRPQARGQNAEQKKKKIYKEDIEKEERAPRSTPPTHKGTRLPNDWKPTDEQLAWARKERPDIDVRKAAEAFRDYWHGVPGAKGCKADWLATFRNWIRNTYGNGKPNGVTSTTKPPPRDLMEPTTEGGRHE